MATKDNSSVRFSLAIEFEGKPKDPIQISAYLFDRSGALLAASEFEKGGAQFSLEHLPRGTRLFVGPSLAQTERASDPSIATMERLNAFEPAWKFEPGREKYKLPTIPDLYWPHWPLCKCRVRGRVVKRSFSPGGVVVEAPVCNARVHVCEVDKFNWVIARLPDADIFRLRDDLQDIIKGRIPWPPIPDPDPGPYKPREIQISNPADVHATKANQVAAVQLFGRSNLDVVALNPQPLPPVARYSGAVELNRPAAQSMQLPTNIQFALGSQSVQTIRRAVLENIDFISPLICHWRWLKPWFYRCDELRVITTDDNGNFDTWIWYSCLGDKPDLYFWVEYSVGGVWTTVHRPSMHCNVWWNYPCGTFVTIGVTDPRVSGCGDVPEVIGKQVVVKTIGREVSMGEINVEPLPADPTYPAAAGTVKNGWINPTHQSPFGEVVEPRVDFGTGLKPAGVTHYRWSYRPLGSTSEADWTSITETITRHYRETTPPLAPVIYKSILVGPDPSQTGHFFLIDPELPVGGEKFEVLDERIDLASARWDTSKVPDGKYELKLELFRNASGALVRVDLTAEGIALSQIIDPAPLSEGTYSTQLATGNRLLIDSGTGHVVGFRLVLHVDNRVCSGTINSVSVSPGTNDTKCGFLVYGAGANATISFRASHPENFASFSFSVARVATLLPSASASGLVEAPNANGFVRMSDVFSKSVSVASLFNEGLAVDEVPCDRAAFAESLHVYALATNGYGRLSYLDAPRGLTEVALRGFALSNT